MKIFYRGIDSDFAEAFKKVDSKLYEEHKMSYLLEYNNYLNLYYNSDSIAKLTYTGKK